MLFRSDHVVDILDDVYNSGIDHNGGRCTEVHWGRILVDAGVGESVPGSRSVVDFVDANYVPRWESFDFLDGDEWWVDRRNWNVADGWNDGSDFPKSVPDHGGGESLGLACEHGLPPVGFRRYSREHGVGLADDHDERIRCTDHDDDWGWRWRWV